MNRSCLSFILIAFGAGVLVSLILPPWILIALLGLVIAAVGVLSLKRC